MNIVPINFSDPGFNPDYTADFQLVIILNSDSFDYAVRHHLTHQLVRVSTGNLLDELLNPQENHLFSAANYQSVFIAANSDSFCLIPDAVFTPENLGNYAAFLSVKEADLVLTDQIANGKNTVIFTLPEGLVKQIETQYPSAKIQFAPKSWIKKVFEEKISGQNLYLFLEENRLKILFPKQENIQFYNQFECPTTDEIIYFTALVANQLQLHPAETSLLICGETDTDQEAMLRLSAYFKEVKFFDTSGLNPNEELASHKIIKFTSLN